LRALGMPVGILFASIWRTFAASTFMAVGLYWMLGSPFEGYLPRPAWLLAAAIGVGAVLYIAGLFGLWWVSGRPASAESIVLNRAHAALRTLVPGLSTKP